MDIDKLIKCQICSTIIDKETAKRVKVVGGISIDGQQLDYYYCHAHAPEYDEIRMSFYKGKDVTYYKNIEVSVNGKPLTKKRNEQENKAD